MVPRGSGSRHAGAHHEFLGEPLRRFDAGRGRRRPEGPESSRRKPVNKPRGQRRFGADDSQVESPPDRLGDQAVEVVAPGRVARGQLRDARVARRTVQVQRWIVALQLPGNRVFATAAADDQGFHFSSLDVLNAPSNASRARPSTPEIVAIASLAWSP